MIVELAERARLTPDEFRARLNDAQIGSSGHGFAWLSKARALADQIAKENGGVLPGQTVPFFANDNDQQAIIAERELHDRLRKAFAASGNERVRATKFKTWFDRGTALGPAGEFLSMSWRLCLSIAPDSHPAAKDIIDAIPDALNSFDVFCTPWSESGHS
jgi:hypothetical protein